MSNRINALDGAIADLNDAPKVNIKGKSYSQVATRVEVFRKHFGLDLSIITDIIVADTTHVIIKASISSAEGVVIATGMAEEMRGSSAINKTSALENCETSAIGRAMAAFGLHGGEYATADEVANAIKQQGANGKKADEAPAGKSVRVQRGSTATTQIHAPVEGDFREKLEAALADCQTVEAVNKLAGDNKHGTTNYKKLYPDRAKSLKEAFDNKRAQLAQAPIGEAA